jgi:hypothetical protein
MPVSVVDVEPLELKFVLEVPLVDVPDEVPLAVELVDPVLEFESQSGRSESPPH